MPKIPKRFNTPDMELAFIIGIFYGIMATLKPGNFQKKITEISDKYVESVKELQGRDDKNESKNQ